MKKIALFSLALSLIISGALIAQDRGAPAPEPTPATPTIQPAPTPAPAAATRPIEGIWKGTAATNGAETVEIKKNGAAYTFILANAKGVNAGSHGCTITEATAEGKTGTIVFTSGSLKGVTLKFTITADNNGLALSWGTSYTRK